MAPSGCGRSSAPIAYASAAPTGAHPSRGVFRGSRSDTRGNTDVSAPERAPCVGSAGAKIEGTAPESEALTAASTSASFSSTSGSTSGSKSKSGTKPKSTLNKSLAGNSFSSSSSRSSEAELHTPDLPSSNSQLHSQSCRSASSNTATQTETKASNTVSSTSPLPTTAKAATATAAAATATLGAFSPTATSVKETPTSLEASLGEVGCALFADLPPDTLTKVLSFLNIRELIASCALSTQHFNAAASHEHWHWFVMQYFGVYYDDYMRSVQVTDPLRWRRLFIYVRQVHQCVDQRTGTTRELPQKLRSCCIMESANKAAQTPSEQEAQSEFPVESRGSRPRYTSLGRQTPAEDEEGQRRKEQDSNQSSSWDQDLAPNSENLDGSHGPAATASGSPVPSPAPTPSPSRSPWHQSSDAASGGREPGGSESSTGQQSTDWQSAPWPPTMESPAPDNGTSSSSSAMANGRRKRRRRYRGSLELADNCNIFFWENGRYIQIVQVSDGRVLREIDTGQSFRRFFHRLANIRNRLFVCLNDCIKMWEFTTDGHDPEKPPVTLSCPTREGDHAKAPRRPLELLVHRRRLILLENFCCLLWDIDTLEFVCFIQHKEDPPPPRRSLPEPDWPWPSTEFQGLEVQWMGDQIVTWLRNASRSLKVWTLNGEETVCLSMDSPLKQVDVARVTWVSVKTLDHFILAGLDSQSIVCLWDSKQNFARVYRFYCGCSEPFDLVLTQDFLAVVNDNEDSNQLELFFWKLWLHPNFEAESGADAAQAARLRLLSVEQGGQPDGANLMTHHGRLEAARMEAEGGRYPLTFPDGAIRNMRDDTNLRYLAWQLRHNAKPIKTLAVTDVDAYFASYRNFLNICSFHKSGQESLAVYRSSSLRKKMYFPPAKHTKFEEWLALQMHADGSVVVHDFRPNQVPFDALPPGRLFGIDRPSNNIEHSDRR